MVKKIALLLIFLRLRLKLQESDCHYSLNYFIKHSRNSNFWNQLLNFFSNLKYKWSILAFIIMFSQEICMNGRLPVWDATARFPNRFIWMIFWEWFQLQSCIISHLQRLIRIRITFLCYSLHTRDLWIFGTCSTETAMIGFVHAAQKFESTMTRVTQK